MRRVKIDGRVWGQWYLLKKPNVPTGLRRQETRDLDEDAWLNEPFASEWLALSSPKDASHMTGCMDISVLFEIAFTPLLAFLHTWMH